jgi:hypothetical protein
MNGAHAQDADALSLRAANRAVLRRRAEDGGMGVRAKARMAMPMALDHIFLHIGLCSAVARATPDTPVSLHVTMAYQQGGNEIDKVVKFARDYDAQTVVEFDVPRNTYRLRLEVPKFNCSVTDFIDVLADQNRTVTEILVDGPPEAAPRVTILDGAAPMSFVYVKPTFVLFDKSLACNAPITPPLPSHISVEYDPTAYYASLYVDPAADPSTQEVLALRLRTPTGLAHYVHVPIPFPVPWNGWPNVIHFQVSEDMIDTLATEKTDTLLCPKLWESTSH